MGIIANRMPTYEYRCANDHTFEVVQSMFDDPVTRCEQCGASVERVFHPIAVHFKGSGFYTTDYAKKGSDNSSGSESKGDSGSKSDSDSKSDSGSKSGSGSSSKSEPGSSSKPKSDSKPAKKSSE